MTRCLVIFGTLFVSALPALADDPVVTERGLDGFIRVDALPTPDHPYLQKGREIWGDTCGGCHGGNKATGAPKITSSKAWATRIDQGMDTLIDHAVNGFVGPKYMQMPALGGNTALTDEEVSAAVAFMVWTSGGDDIVQDYLKTLEGMEQ
jgi:cytochrome c5